MALFVLRHCRAIPEFFTQDLQPGVSPAAEVPVLGRHRLLQSLLVVVHRDFNVA